MEDLPSVVGENSSKLTKNAPQIVVNHTEDDDSNVQSTQGGEDEKNPVIEDTNIDKNGEYQAPEFDSPETPKQLIDTKGASYIIQTPSDSKPLQEELESIMSHDQLETSTGVAGDTVENSDLASTSSRYAGSRISNTMAPAMHLQPAFMLKLALADPQTTMTDVNSVISKEGHSNALSKPDERPNLPPTSPNTATDFKNSIRIWQQKTLELEVEGHQTEADVNSTDLNFVRRTLTNITSPIFSYNNKASEANVTDVSPKIITYRKNTHERKESDSYAELLEAGARFDPKLYVNEKYKNSSYRYATIKRNVDFHQIFRSHDLTDRLLDDFACALSREILLQGRIYVTENSVCFNSNLLGWVTSLVIEFSDVIKIEKKSTAGLFPNGIQIETKDVKHNFASFLSRDSTYDFLRTVWLGSVGKDLADLDAIVTDDPSKEPSEDIRETSQRRISNYIMSIDEDAHGEDNWSEGNLEITDDENDVYSSEEEAMQPLEEPETKIPENEYVEPTATAGSCVALKSTSEYQHNGPHSNPPTKIDRTFEDSENEKEVGNVVIDAPLGIVFDVMFGSVNTAFHRKVLDSQGATEVSDYGPFLPQEDDQSLMERKYTYRRPLGYSIGPKSTKCCVSEIIEHLDYSDHVVVLSITATPDVPSGGSFTVRTRYYFLWAENNHTRLRIAFYVKWSGSSWIKKVVENLTLSAQEAVTADILKMLQEEIEEHTEKQAGTKATSLVNEKITASPIKKVPVKSREEKKRTKVAKIPERPEGFSSVLVVCIVVLFILIAVLVLIQWRLVAISLQTKALMEKQLQLTSGLVRLVVENSDSKAKLARLGGDKLEQVALLVKQALLLMEESEKNDGR